jgi:hypothetical protein
MVAVMSRADTDRIRRSLGHRGTGDPLPWPLRWRHWRAVALLWFWLPSIRRASRYDHSWQSGLFVPSARYVGPGYDPDPTPNDLRNQWLPDDPCCPEQYRSPWSKEE